MSDQEGAGSASNPEATLTHPSARDIPPIFGFVLLPACPPRPPP